MPKIKTLDLVVAGTLLALLFAWHYRAAFIEVWRTAEETSALLAKECK